jgi:hypothetical protein
LKCVEVSRRMLHAELRRQLSKTLRDSSLTSFACPSVQLLYWSKQDAAPASEAV